MVKKEDFVDVVQKAWNITCESHNAIDIWQCKVRNLREKSKRLEYKC